MFFFTYIFFNANIYEQSMAEDDNTITERRETNTRICWDLNKIPNEKENGDDLNENI